jgi:hypothetical protein
MSGKKIDTLMDIWAECNGLYDDDGMEADDKAAPPFADKRDLYGAIDAIKDGAIQWQSLSVKYDRVLPENPPSWMTATYDVWYRDALEVMEYQIGNPDFANEFDFAPKQVFDIKNKRQYTDLMSGNWAWEEAVRTYVTIPYLSLTFQP